MFRKKRRCCDKAEIKQWQDFNTRDLIKVIKKGINVVSKKVEQKTK